MGAIALIPAFVVGLAIYWLGRPGRVALLAAAIAFVVVLVALILFSLPITMIGTEVTP